MKAALEVLGFATYHYVSAIENPKDFEMWEEAFLGKYATSAEHQRFTREDWDELLGHHGSVTDQPCCIFAPELVEAYPEAKVVLHERDVDKWYRSFNDTVIEGSANPFIPIAEIFDHSFIGPMARQSDYITKWYFGMEEQRKLPGFHLNRINPKYVDEYRAKAKDSFRRHNQTVRNAVAKDRLLLIKLEDGWEPLCKFLGKPVPDVPFPKVNETEVVQEKIRLVIAKSMRKTAVEVIKFVLPFVALAIAYWTFF